MQFQYGLRGLRCNVTRRNGSSMTRPNALNPQGAHWKALSKLTDPKSMALRSLWAIVLV
jgi:hypothetical protein